MSSPVPLELSAKIAGWRLRAAEGTLTLEEMKEAVIYLRAGRLSAAVSAATAKKVSASAAKKSKAPAQGDMLDELEGL